MMEGVRSAGREVETLNHMIGQMQGALGLIQSGRADMTRVPALIEEWITELSRLTLLAAHREKGR